MAVKQIVRSDVLQSTNNLNWNELHYEFFQNLNSENTRKCYLRDIKQFYQFIEDNISNLSSILEVKRLHIVAYRDYLNQLDQAITI